MVPKGLKLLPARYDTEVVFMAQPSEVSIITAKEYGTRDSNFGGILLQHF